MLNDYTQYIISFLLGEGNECLLNQVSYGDNPRATIVIRPSTFFEKGVYLTENSFPKLPLKEIDGVPILFGEEKVIQNEKQTVVYGDLVASTFFLISRYEECLNHEDRDSYGRLIGKKSLPYRAGFLMRPIVDEYGKLLRRWLRERGIQAIEPKEDFKHIYLTHDVDEIWQWDNLYKALKTVAKRLIRHEKKVLESLGSLIDYQKYDSAYTFPWITQMDRKCIENNGTDKCTSVYFIKGGGKAYEDNLYYKKEQRVKKLADYLMECGAVLGIHASMSAGKNPQELFKEKMKLEEILDKPVKWNRHHFLCSKEPEDMEALMAAGITDDFTMGYADIVGFRLGTSRAVRWINPLKKELTSLILHPLTVMECTLDAERYMNLKEDETFEVICKLLNAVKKNHGEAVLLWHNTSVALSETSFQRRIYERVLAMLGNCYKTTKEL